MDRTLASLHEAVKIAKALPRGGRKRWPHPKGLQVKRLRDRLGVSQSEFARRFGLDLASVKNWELDRRVPDQANCLLLRMIEHDPKTVGRLVREVQAEVDKKELEPA
jgi:putative transcriptional regulator